MQEVFVCGEYGNWWQGLLELWSNDFTFTWTSGIPMRKWWMVRAHACDVIFYFICQNIKFKIYVLSFKNEDVVVKWSWVISQKNKGSGAGKEKP